MRKTDASFFPSSPLFESKVRLREHKTTLPHHPRPLRIYCWLTSLTFLKQTSQHLPMFIPCVLCASWSPECGMVSLFGVHRNCIISTKITRSSILIPFCSHLCLLFTARPLSTFSASLVGVYAYLKRRACKKTVTTINQRERKVCLPFALL